jgi:hypothetical protein
MREAAITHDEEGEPASRRYIPDAHALLEGRRSKAGGPVYIVGGMSERRVTLYSQQVRALNIVAALGAVHGDSLAPMDIAVVGAGAAGVAAAAALERLGAMRVTVYEEAAAPMHAQRASYTRFLHPRMFHWPEPGWDDVDAKLPIGNWTASYADKARRTARSRGTGACPLTCVRWARRTTRCSEAFCRACRASYMSRRVS